MALHQPAPNLLAPISSTSSSYLSSPHQCTLPPLSSPWTYRIEWFENDGNSLGFALIPLANIASSSHPPYIPYAPSPPPPHPSTPMVKTPPSPPLHVFSNCDAWTCLLATWENLQSLIFDACRDMDDMCFRMEIMDRWGECLDFFPTSLIGSLHAPITMTSSSAATVNSPATSTQETTPRTEE